MSATDDLERRKLALELLKLRLEQKKFRSEAAKRIEEVNKFRAEVEKLTLENEDLKVPYEKRPAFRIQRLQMIGATAAVVSLILSVGAIKPILDAQRASIELEQEKKDLESAERDLDHVRGEADKARQERNEAVKSTNEAIQRRDDAVFKRDEALDLLRATREDLNDKSAELTQLAAGVKSAADDIIVAPLREIIAQFPISAPPGIANPDVHFLLSNIRRDEPSKQLETSLTNGGKDQFKTKVEFLLREATASNHPIFSMNILVVLRISATQHADWLDDLSRYRIDAAALNLLHRGTTPNEVLGLWAFATVSFGELGQREACWAYEHSYRNPIMNTRSNSSVDPNRSLDILAFSEFLSIHSPGPQCSTATFDLMDTRVMDIVPRSIHPFPFPLYERPNQISIMRAFYPHADSDLRDMLNHHLRDIAVQGTFPKALRDASTTVNDLELFVGNWVATHRSLAEILNEPGLQRLRKCSLTIPISIRGGAWVEERQVRDSCPETIW